MAKQLPLPHGRFALVDDHDYEQLRHYRWYTNGQGYVVTTVTVAGTRQTLYLHRLLLQAPPDLLVDHINGNRLDNRRANLRLATHSQNQFNRRRNVNSTSGFKGVSWHSRKRKWVARIQVNGRRIHLGYFDSAKEAAKAYDDAARKHFGPYARLNFPAHSELAATPEG